jgi:hypothetical protein
VAAAIVSWLAAQGLGAGCPDVVCEGDGLPEADDGALVDAAGVLDSAVMFGAVALPLSSLLRWNTIA